METSNIEVKAPRKVRGNISIRSKKDGTKVYGVQFRRDGKALSGTFASKQDAKRWLAEQEVGGDRPTPAKIKLPECFDLYIKSRAEIGQPVSEAIELQFKRLAAHPVLKDVRVDQVDRKVALDYCVSRKADGIAPSTILGEYVRLNLAIRGCAKAFEWGKFNPLDGVREELYAAKLIAESNKRTRRPTGSELDRILAHLRAQDIAAPAADIVAVAALNAFRRGEIVKLRWTDLRVEDSGIVVRNRKDASAVGDTEALVPLLPAALEIILRQPRVEGEDRIFPYSADTISGHFTAACKALEIEGLHFHDLRHEAISTIGQIVGTSEAMMISGHKTERHFRRYVNFGAEESRKIANKLANVTLKSATPANVQALKIAA